jgi:hypothetical protein
MYTPFTRSLPSRAVTTAAAVLLLLLTCADDTSTAGIQGTGRVVFSFGRITAFGSIFVDGVEYNTAGAQIRFDDEPAAESQLRVGQIVAVQGRLDANETTGTAIDVSFTGDALGAISQIDAAGGSFVVLGQTIRVNDETLFGAGIQPANIGGLQVGAVVEVSAFANATGDLVASRIDRRVGSAARQVKGTLQALDPISATFQINDLTVNYSGVAPPAGLAEGATATVRGALSSSGTLVATNVDVSFNAGGSPGELGKLEGIITSFDSQSRFTVGDQVVVTTTATHFVFHEQALAPNVSVAIHGIFNASGDLVATQVTVKPHSL